MASCPRCHSKNVWTDKSGKFVFCSACGFPTDDSSPARYFRGGVFGTGI